MKSVRVVLLLASIVLILTCWYQVTAASHGLVVRYLDRGSLQPVFMTPAPRFVDEARPDGATGTRALEREAEDAEEADETTSEEPRRQDPAEPYDITPVRDAPGVLVAHGFASSKQIMLGYAHVLAHAGYGVLLWDFTGHGAHPGALEADTLLEDLGRARRILADQPEVDPERLALVGHSMGARTVLEAAAREPELYDAVVAVSPPPLELAERPDGDSPAFGPAVPPNLMLQAGEWEPEFVEAARRILAEAGGTSDAFGARRARELVVVPRAEHVSILFRPASHEAALEWLDSAYRALGIDPAEQATDQDPRKLRGYEDDRIFWYVLQLLGAVVVLGTLAPAIQRGTGKPQATFHWPMHWLALALGPMVAAVALSLIGRVLDVATLGGMAVGGAFALWMLLAGGLWLLLGVRPRAPTRADLLWGGFLFAFLWLAFGALGHQVWIHWGLTQARWLRWPLLSAACLPWFLAAEATQGEPEGRGRFAWWAGQAVAMVGGLLLTILLVPDLDVLRLLLPLLPPLLALLTFAGSRVNRVWAYGIGCSLFFGWLLAAAFPMV